VFDVGNGWTETGINWNNAPQPTSTTPLASAGAVTKGKVAEISLPLSNFTRGNGVYSFEIVTSSSDSALFSSREAATGKPELVLAQGGGTLPTLTADFRSDKQSGTAPLTVIFDSSPSTGSPTSWTWDLDGDNVVDSAQQNPTFVYNTPGTYPVKLTIGNGSTTSTVTKTNYINVTNIVVPPPPPPGITATLVGDAAVTNSKPTTNYGTQTTLQLRQGTPSNNITYHVYLQFNVAGIVGPLTSAKLRLSVTDASPDGGSVFDVANNWTEAGINWNNAPQPTSTTPLANAGAVVKGKTVDINLPLSEFVRGNGTYSFELVTSSSDSALYNSKQSTSPPLLILTQ
jgi:PKD repeat protein